MIVDHGPGEFFRLRNVPENAMSWLRYQVPSEYRYYEESYWFVHSKHLLEIIELAYKQTGRVDYSNLNDYVQMDIANAKQGWRVYRPKSKSAVVSPSSDLDNAYRLLHLRPSASFSIVCAVWRCLAKENHPDRGGDVELFRKYTEAFEQIKKEKEEEEGT